MKEHYVSFEYAQALKRLGFDWYVRGYYTRDDNFKKVREVTALNHNDTKKFKNILSAPRLDQAAAWLREKHHLSVEPICNMVRQWNVNVCEIDNFGTAVFSKMNLDTYELALSDGLDAAIELLGKEVKE